MHHSSAFGHRLRRTAARYLGLVLMTASLAAPGTPSGLSFVVLGDWGKGNVGQRAVARELGRAAEVSEARFVVSVGDNFYPHGVSGVDDPHWRDEFEGVYTAPALYVPWHPVLGNHDYRGRPDAQIAYSQTSSRWQFPAPYYKHSERIDAQTTADFFYLDTTPLERAVRWPHTLWPFANEQYAWLARELAASHATWKIVVGHHPVVSGGSHGGAPALAEKLQPLLERHGVAAYICGHDHALEHIVVHDVNYFVVGAGAEATKVHPIEGTRAAFAELGFMTARVERDVLTMSFIDTTGTALYSTVIPHP